MLIRDAEWGKIREQFTEEEKLDLRETVTGECICPKGFFIEESDLVPELAAKISAAIKGVR
jgi:hypothetical protein